MTTITYCDKCNLNLQPKATFTKAQDKIYYYKESFGEGRKFDLCEKCYKKLIRFLEIKE